MEAHSPLLVSLVVATAAASIGIIIALRLRQSAILGYIIAGLAIGPFTPGLVSDVVTVQALADVGIIFLLFAIGVELSLRELIAYGRVAIVGGLTQIAALVGVGFLVGLALGWLPMESLFLGAVVAISSSVVTIKTLSERGELGAVHGRIAVAWSAVQDLATVALVVILSTVSSGEEVLPTLALTTGKAAAFLLVLGVVGSFVLPWLFERVAALRSRELFIFVVCATALGAAYASSLFGLSLALGAFVAGVVIGESDLSLQILGELMPLRDIFAGLFFVSVGMFLDPTLILSNPVAVLAILVLIIPIKALAVALLTRMAGYSARTSTLAGVSLSQSAEFSFLLASVGASLKVVSSEAFGLMLAGSALSVIISPPLYKASRPLAAAIDRRFPSREVSARPASAKATVEGEALAPRGHAIVCGYGQVGQVIVGALKRRRFPVVVVEEDLRVVRQLRGTGVEAVVGDAGNPAVLEHLGFERARVLVVAIPDQISARQVVEYARRANPRLDIVVRTHSREERQFLRRRKVDEVVLGEVETALEMTRHTLRRFGVSATEVQATVQRLRERLALDESEVEDESAESKPE